MDFRPRNKINASFNLTSMTDVVFLLLIFFMVSASLLYPYALDVLLPESSSKQEAKTEVTVTITKSEEYYLNGTKIDFERLESELGKILDVKAHDERFFSLQSDKSVSVENVIKVMDIAYRKNYRLFLSTTVISQAH